MVSTLNTSTSGSIRYEAGLVTYDTTKQLTSSVTYSQACAAASFGFTAMDSNTCAQIQARRSQGTEQQANCRYSNGVCNCDVTITHADIASSSYVVSGSTITESDGTTYEFCVSGNTLGQREFIGGNVYGRTQLKRH
jgi:hypothetical protein